MDYRRLIEKGREAPFEVDGLKLVLRRPSEREYTFRYSRLDLAEQTQAFAFDCVVGWDMTGDRLAPGVGTEERVPFSRELWKEFCEDKADLMLKISAEIYARLTAFRAAKAEAAGK